MGRGYTHALTIDLDAWAALARDADDPDRTAPGAKLVGMAQGGQGGLSVPDGDSPG
ncbi:MAG: hypothetical protein GVY34_01870 [Alphaproteobacteria bacterium]|jgi:hypothetical protein|nr:hypothetical protein [Alphaproteobacteria bacterium]